MTLNDLYESLSAFPGHDNLKREDFRITQEVYDPGNPQKVHFYLTGPETFYVFMTSADDGYGTTLAEYAANFSDEA